MKKSRILISLYLGYAVYSLLVFFHGSSGLHAMGELAEYRMVLKENLDELRAVNADLSDSLTSLRKDPEKVMLTSRELGLFSRNEHIIKISGYTDSEVGYPAGHVLIMEMQSLNLEPQFRTAGVSVSVLLYVLSFLIVRPEYSGRKRTARNVLASSMNSET